MKPTSRNTARPFPRCLSALFAAAGLVACAVPGATPPDAARPPSTTAHASGAPQATAGAPSAAEAAASLPTAVPARYQAAAAYSAEHAGLVLLIVQGDEVAFEVGQNGHDPEAPLWLQGASESFFGILAVAADADGLLDLDEPAVFTLPEFAADPRKREIRIRQLLNYTSGLEPGILPLRNERIENLYDWALALSMLADPGERFQYGPGQLYVFAEILERKLAQQGQDPVAYLDERILDPIGLDVADWERDASGNPDVARGARLVPREWAKLGVLLKNRGRWQGREIVPAQAVAAVFEASAASPEFGLTLWLNRAPAAGRGTAAFYPKGMPDLALAAGQGNQRLYVIPSLDLVIVRMGEHDRHWRDEEFLALVVEGHARAAGATAP